MNVPVFDVRGSDKKESFGQDLFHAFVHPVTTVEPRSLDLHQSDGSVKTRCLPEKMRRLPSESLYDAKGLELFEKLTELEDEYYLTRCEREILNTHMPDITEHIPDGARIVELGCGSLSKTAIILDHVRKARRRGVKFYALDIEENYLRSSLVALVKDQQDRNAPVENNIEHAGIFGGYTDVLPSFLKDIGAPRVILWLGSSIGNFTRSDASAFLRRFQQEGMEDGDIFFIGIDKRKDPTVVATAYNDSAGVTREFGMNGLNNLNKIIGSIAFDRRKIDFFSGYNDEEGRNEVYYKSLVAQNIRVPCRSGNGVVTKEVKLEENELVRYSFSYKYSNGEIEELAADAGLSLEKLWTDSKGMYNFCMFRKTSSDPALNC